MTDLKAAALELFQAAIDRADPAAALRAQFAASPLPELPEGGRNFILAVGKAAIPMMRTALEFIPDPAQALAVTNPENHTDIPGATVLSGSHPVPDEASETAGLAAIELAQSMSQNDRLIALISGGGSALMVAPAPGLTLADKAAVNKLLLASGLEINDMNLIRQQLSDLKGGGLLRHAAPANVQAYILSDVIGDDLRAIASGPTVTPIGDRAKARETMEHVGIWDQVPEAVRAHLSAIAVETETPPQATNTLIGSNRYSLKAMMALAADTGWNAKLITHRLVGGVQDAAETVIRAAQAAPVDQPVALVFGGETTVQITGTGLGGRNQELALRVAQRASDIPGDWVFLSGGTDGRDGPTEAAGGMVTPNTWAQIGASGADPDTLLANNDSNAALAAGGALVMTGGTGTNVADVQVFLRRP